MDAQVEDIDTVTSSVTPDEVVVVEITEAQKAYYADLVSRVNGGEFTMNKAYEQAIVDGDSEDLKGFKGSFAEWIKKLSDLKILTNDTEQGRLKDFSGFPMSEAKNYVIPVLIGIGVGFTIIAIAKYLKNKQ